MPERNNPATSQTIISTRVFAAPRAVVFAAFRDPTRLAGWWGPQGFTSTFHEFDFRPGGAWRFTMSGPDGAAYAMDKQFMEIAVPDRIVLRHFQPSHDFILTMTFVARGECTELTWTMDFSDPVEATKVRAIILRANEENFDRLAAHLSTMPSL